MEIFEALNLAPKDVIALVGGGGKTSIMFALGSEAKKRGWQTVLTTTTRIFMPDDPHWPVIVTKDEAEMKARLQGALAAVSAAVVGSELTGDRKMLGVKPQFISELLQVGADVVIAEADGSAGRPFKAPAGHEPVVPGSTTVFVPVVGIDCLGQPLSAENTHRPELVAKIAQIELGDVLTPEAVAKVLTHPMGYLKALPPNCRWTPFINKVETDRDTELARQLAGLIGRVRPCRVIIGAARSASPVLEILDFSA